MTSCFQIKQEEGEIEMGIEYHDQDIKETGTDRLYYRQVNTRTYFKGCLSLNSLYMRWKIDGKYQWKPDWLIESQVEITVTFTHLLFIRVDIDLIL